MGGLQTKLLGRLPGSFWGGKMWNFRQLQPSLLPETGARVGGVEMSVRASLLPFSCGEGLFQRPLPERLCIRYLTSFRTPDMTEKKRDVKKPKRKDVALIPSEKKVFAVLRL